MGTENYNNFDGRPVYSHMSGGGQSIGAEGFSDCHSEEREREDQFCNLPCNISERAYAKQKDASENTFKFRCPSSLAHR
jgi:hypothetical protein